MNLKETLRFEEKHNQLFPERAEIKNFSYSNTKNQQHSYNIVFSKIKKIYSVNDFELKKMRKT